MRVERLFLDEAGNLVPDVTLVWDETTGEAVAFSGVTFDSTTGVHRVSGHFQLKADIDFVFQAFAERGGVTEIG